MSDIHALVGAYAVDALDPVERELFEKHLEECDDCRAEVTSLQEAGALLATLTAVPPPPALKDKVMADIATVRPLPPSLPQRREERRRRRWIPAAMAAAAAVAVLGGGAVILEPWENETSQQQLTATEQVLQAPDAKAVRAELDGGAQARLVRSKALGQAVLVTQDMPSAPDGRVYQLWLQNDRGAMVPAGLMPNAANQEVLLDGDAASATAAGITIEPDGGSEQPTTQPIALFDFEKAV